MTHDYYEVLGVSRGATAADIKSAWRRLAQQYHPDKNPGDPRAAERFKEIGEAYGVLGDDEKRKHYDVFGTARFAEAGFAGGVGDLLNDLVGSDLLKSWRRDRRRGADLSYRLEVDFATAARGGRRTITLPRHGPCALCHGSGGAPGAPAARCARCDGRGEVGMKRGLLSLARSCPDCDGRGQRASIACPECRGRGRVRREEQIGVDVPPGIESGTRLRLRGQGDAGQGDAASGDLYVEVTCRPQPLLTRQGRDVCCEVPVPLATAALGDEVDVPTLDGLVRMRVPAGTQPGAVFRLRGRGVGAPGDLRRGDQLVTVDVEVPVDLTPEQRELLARFVAAGAVEAHPRSRIFAARVKELFG